MNAIRIIVEVEGDDEPEYTEADVRERNPDYEKR